MSGQTFSQKILGAKAGKAVVPGEIVDVIPDVAMSHDNTAAIARTFATIGVDRLYDPDMHVIVLDHCAPAANEKFATNHQEIRAFVEAQGIESFYDVASGVCHQILVEQGFALPGRLIVGSDSHTTSYGALGAFSTGIGRSEMAVIMATGKIWLRVPETMRIDCDGRFAAGVYPKDLILKIIGDIGADGALYRAVEFDGPAIADMSVSGRLTLCNMTIEMGGKNGYVHPDQKTLDFLNGRARENFETVTSDPDAEYIERLRYDVSGLEPQIARPHTVDNVCDVSEVAGTRIDQVVIGSCTNGRLDDLHQAAAILEGREVKNGVRCLILPASSDVTRAATQDGTMLKLIDAGCLILNANCGPCMGNHEGALAPGEKALSSANRNFKGRMGCKEAEIFLGSPASCAAAAITGEICDVREIASPEALAAGLEA
ncbi:homoaconitate hydratase family protein [bacterium]|nr:homoaconitate hydratase family protein [bacterium]